MPKLKCFGLVCVIFAALCPLAAAEQPVESVVKIFVTSNKMDFYRPWQSHGISSSSGSGAIIYGQRILTNAHVVSDHTFIQVKKHNDPKKYTAKVIAIGSDCDLALLSVEDEDFFEGTRPLEYGGLPKLQDTVTVLGFPQGGEKLSITEGVVSRIEVSSYALSSRKLLSVQIDAAINPGNSGGPVTQDGKMVGIAMQVLNSGQNIGYMIPIPIISHFFEDLEDGEYDGFPMLGINYGNTENDHLRSFYQASDIEGGVIITKILPFSSADKKLNEGDIILAIDGVPIGEDGTFVFRGNERLTLPHLISNKQIGEKIEFSIWRDGQAQTLFVDVEKFTTLVPPPDHFEKPTYFIYGGLVFTILSADLIHAWGKRWWEQGPVNLTYFIVGNGRLNAEMDQEKVVLLNVLSDDINVGYHGQGNEIIESINGEEFKSFREFVQLIDRAKRTSPYTIIKNSAGGKYIIANEDIDAIDQAIIKRNNIPARFSEDVGGWLGIEPAKEE